MSVFRSMDIQLINIVVQKTPGWGISEITKTGTIIMVGIKIIREIGMETAFLKVASSLEDLIGTTPGMAMEEPVRL